MGAVAQERGDYDGALAYYRRSLEMFESLGDRAGVSKSLHNMGNVAYLRGEYDAALEYYRRSLEMAEALGDRAEVSKVLHQMGMVAQARGDLDGALEYYRRSLETFEALGDRAGVSKSLHQMGRVAQARGDYDAALDYYRRSLEIAEALGDRAGAAISRAQMSRLYEQLGQLDQALTLIRQAEAEFARMGAAQLAQAQRDRARIEARLRGEVGDSEAEESKGMTLEDILRLVAAGCQGDAQAGQQAYDIAQALQQPSAPSGYSALGKALQRILEGLRDYDEIMAGLPEEVGPVVRQVLEGNRQRMNNG
jgi:tetratricopeptide (TPR) repeat protein